MLYTENIHRFGQGYCQPPIGILVVIELTRPAIKDNDNLQKLVEQTPGSFKSYEKHWVFL